MPAITTIAQLEAIYGSPGETKEVDRITPHYRTFIELSPFASLATSGPEGLDCSPRGDLPGFVRCKTTPQCTGTCEPVAPGDERLPIPREIDTPFHRHELRRAAVSSRELLEPELAVVVHLTERVCKLCGREEMRCFRKCDPSALSRQQTLQ
jgi:hypothetical protein